MQNVTQNNSVEIAGTVNGPLSFSHEVYGEGFYSFQLKVPRFSESCDMINVMVSERLIHNMELTEGDVLLINGQFRSYNKCEEKGSRLLLSVFARDLEKLQGEEPIKNNITLEGFICKPPVYRETPFGREISDILVAVNRQYNKSDYIPCIAWGRNARYAATLAVGEHVKLQGRIQSREYQKRVGEDSFVTRTAFEVSVSKLEVLNHSGKDEKTETA